MPNASHYISIVFVALLCLLIHQVNANEVAPALYKEPNKKLNEEPPKELSKEISTNVMVASVSPDFPEGLHVKYMRYLAEQLNLSLQIKPIPLARRIKELEKGAIDIIILGYRENTALTFLFPSYSPIFEYLFVNYDDKDKINNYQQLANATIGLNTGAKLFPTFDKDTNSKKVTVNSVEQKIQLLKHKRIDGFFHTDQSTQAVLEKMELAAQIVKSTWQPNYIAKQAHFVISPASHLFQRKTELEAIIKQGVLNNKFIEIRQTHYQQLSDSEPISNKAISSDSISSKAIPLKPIS